MKKIKFITILLSVLASFTFSSCFNSVFYEVLQDVPPLKATVNGNITSLARYTAGDKEFLLCAANGGLRYKLLSDDFHNAWKTYTALPFDLHRYDYYDGKGYSAGHNGHQIIKVLTDSSTVYLVTAEFTEDQDIGSTAPKKFHIFAKEIAIDSADSSKLSDEGQWVNLTAEGIENANGEKEDFLNFYKDESDDLYYTSFNVFSTNSPQKEHRKVFLRRKNSSTNKAQYFEITGTSISSEKTLQNVENNDNDIDSAAYLGDELYFFDSIAVTTNETANSEATIIYYGKNATLCYFDGSASYEKVNSGTLISSLAYTKDSLLIGRANFNSTSSTYGGIAKTTLDENGIPDDKLAIFESNAESQMPTSYLILSLLAAYPEKNELENDLYASISFKGSGTGAAVSYNNIGLWSYYESRGYWNRE